MEPELLTALKALSDASRLRIVGLLAEGRRMSVEQLAAALSLTPGTVVHHLKRLRDADLVESRPRPPFVDYSLRLGRLGQIGGELDRMGREQAGESVAPMERPAWANAEEGRTLRAFFDGERLLSIPAQHAKRLTVLRFLAETVFERKRKYPEKELNQLLVVRHPDAASLRRYLVDEGFMTRKSSVYRLRPRREWPAPPDQRSRAKVSAETANAPAS
ncbi:MAG: metalloregulator ArsR/SmtB family transcription factor [Chloroflexota bacterium]